MFPFLRGQEYCIGELRAFANELLSKGENDQDLRSDLRTNVQKWAKLRNEELVPFELMTNWLKIPDEFKFIISPKNDPGPDITLILPNRSVGIQITVADPDWNGDGGRTQALENLALKRDGFAWGAGGTYKNGSKGQLISEVKPVDHSAIRKACSDGIIKAVENKLSRPKTTDCLLVYARGFYSELSFEGFIQFLQPIVSEVVAGFNPENAIYPVVVVDSFSSGQIAFSVQADEVVTLFSKYSASF